MVKLKKIKTLLCNHKKVFLILGILMICFLYIPWSNKSTHRKTALPHILWWTPMEGFDKHTRHCGLYTCTFSTQRQDLDIAKSVLFYASDLKIDDLPLPRPPNQLWGMLHEESPRNVPFIQYDIILRHFNLTSTFSRYSDFPITTHHLPNLNNLTSFDYVVPVGEKTMLRRKEGLAPIVFLQTNCDSMSGREDYVRELMRYIDVDSFGKCLQNRDLPKSLTEDYLNNLYSPELSRFLARYKFILAYENGVCHDYITEKFWRPLIVGSVPIYFGSPTIKDWQPNKKSVINIADFPSPKALADFIKGIEQNDTEYNTYLDHKYELLKPITNSLLYQEVRNRRYSLSDSNIFNAFECFVCRELNIASSKQTKIANRRHYDCPIPFIYPPMHTNISNRNDWKSIMDVGKCQAKILDSLLQRNTNFTKWEFDSLLNELIQSNNCQ